MSKCCKNTNMCHPWFPKPRSIFQSATIVIQCDTYVHMHIYIYYIIYIISYYIYMSTQERTLTVIHGNTCAEFLGNFSYPVSSQQRPRIETAWPPSSSSLSASGNEQWRFSFKMFKENVRRVGGKKKQEDNTTKYVLMVQSTQIRPARLWDREQL